MVFSWPNFFIVGAPRSGTTSLYHYLRQSPNFFMPSKKEPHFFTDPLLPIKPQFDEKTYLELFSDAKNQSWIGDASASYLVGIQSPKLIYQKVPNAKIIISLRDPVERSFAAFLRNKINGTLKGSFFENIKKGIDEIKTYSFASLIIRNSLYHDSVKRYIDTFGPSNVLILIFEEWTPNPQLAIQKITKFLGITTPINEIEFKAYNVFEGVKPHMEIRDKSFLVEYFQNDVKKLENLLERKLPWLSG